MCHQQECRGKSAIKVVCVLYVRPWYKDCMCFLVCLYIHMQVRQFQCSCMCTWVHFMCVPPSPSLPRVGDWNYYPLLLLGIDFHVGCLHVSIWLWCVVGLCLFHVSIRFAMYSFSSVLVMVPRECLQWYIVDWVIWTSYPWTQASIARCVTFASIAALLCL